MARQVFECVDWTTVAAMTALVLSLTNLHQRWTKSETTAKTELIPKECQANLTITRLVAVSDLYRETNSTIRATDDVSLKLLGFVPSFVGVAAGLLTKNAANLRAEAILVLVLVGMSATIGLYLWERRNIETCKFFRRRRDVLEAQFGFTPFELAPKPKLLGFEVGKTEAERWLYGASILAWFAPLFVRFC